ncbi:hypothetical protein N6L24_13755 [Cognatishimia sp. SS12]|uniref:hypothetical protein n=1 Tax=Cognatishimia sp. SS12 TaxID=2979465 RepID=UPI00232FC459|nr:hypothetical protein [Cognatishimia sp. SS12]MDC0739348.1 hypothetical protein [Cognatishimia sp. SS12]
MYDKSDPRAQLSPAAKAGKPPTGLVAEHQIATFYDSAPQIEDASGKTWLLRGKNFIIAYSELVPGARLSRADQPDEYVLLLPEGGAAVSFAGTTTQIAGNSIAFLPPGETEITSDQGGVLIRMFTSKAADLLAQCANAGAYQRPRSHMPEFQPLPTPPDGHRVRHYTLDVPAKEGRFGRLFRCTTFMLNIIYPYQGPRDTTKMSPHTHDDFEQCSLLLEGAYMHHLRWPWTTDLSDWKEDVHLKVDGPSALVIPPPVIHTSRAIGAGRNQLVDVFCPPRADFNAKPGWVLNAADYPLPD